MQQIPTRNYINAADCRRIPSSTNHTKGQKKTKTKTKKSQSNPVDKQEETIQSNCNSQPAKPIKASILSDTAAMRMKVIVSLLKNRW
jgi:hypothetical protein